MTAIIGAAITPALFASDDDADCPVGEGCNRSCIAIAGPVVGRWGVRGAIVVGRTIHVRRWRSIGAIVGAPWSMVMIVWKNDTT